MNINISDQHVNMKDLLCNFWSYNELPVYCLINHRPTIQSRLVDHWFKYLLFRKDFVVKNVLF